jgi:hypothetical protein
MICEAYGGEVMKESSVLSGINGTKRVVRTWKMMMKEAVVQYLTEPIKMMKKCGVCCIQIHV